MLNPAHRFVCEFVCVCVCVRVNNNAGAGADKGQRAYGKAEGGLGSSPKPPGAAVDELPLVLATLQGRGLGSGQAAHGRPVAGGGQDLENDPLERVLVPKRPAGEAGKRQQSGSVGNKTGNPGMAQWQTDHASDLLA